MVKRAAQHTKRSFEELKAWFQADNQPKHVDETNWKLHDERAQLIGSHNASAALYQCSQHRKAEDVKRLIGVDLSQPKGWINAARRSPQV